MIWLLLLVPGSFFGGAASAGEIGFPTAVQCVESFVNTMSSIKGYSAKMTKRELFEGKWLEEPIGLWSEGNVIKYTFLKPGSTGIKNSGMQLIYEGGDQLGIVWGDASGFGVIANRAARAVTGNSIELAGETALKGELFTLNRAGYRHLARSLKYHWPFIKKAKLKDVTTAGDCDLKFASSNPQYITLHMSKDFPLQAVEDKFGVYAIHLLEANKDKFKSLFDLFHRKTDVEIRVPDFMLTSEIKLHPKIHLPEKMSIFLNGEKAGEYTFEDIKTW